MTVVTVRRGRGYDPKLENVDRLREQCQEWQVVCKAGDVPVEYSTRSWHVIEDQGSTPSCGGQMLSNVLECAHYVATRGEVVQLSRLFAWVKSQMVDGGRPSPRRGISINAAATVAVETGVPLESLVPFSEDEFPTTFPQSALADAATRKVRNRYWIDSYEKLIDFLQSGAGAAGIGVPWNFSRRSWHAVTLSGWFANGDIEGENSWGPDWDEDGRFRWAPEIVDRYFKTPGVVCVGLSDMTTPAVRDWDWKREFLV